MDIETLRLYCLSKKAASEDTPFGPDTLVFRVVGKIFALTSLDTPAARVNLKCDPEYAVELRERYPESVLPGYHMNKQHWNTVELENGLDEKLIRTLVDHSYEIIVASLKKAQKELLNNM